MKILSFKKLFWKRFLSNFCISLWPYWCTFALFSLSMLSFSFSCLYRFVFLFVLNSYAYFFFFFVLLANNNLHCSDLTWPNWHEQSPGSTLYLGSHHIVSLGSLYHTSCWKSCEWSTIDRTSLVSLSEVYKRHVPFKETEETNSLYTAAIWRQDCVDGRIFDNQEALDKATANISGSVWSAKNIPKILAETPKRCHKK